MRTLDMTNEVKYVARFAQTEADLHAAQKLRALAFHGNGQIKDADAFDAQYQHVLIETADNGHLVGCFRFMQLANGDPFEPCYSEQFYDLSMLADYDGSMLELGRFCIDPDCYDPAIVRVAWAEITRFVVQQDIGLIFGCSSFKGVEVEPYEDAFAMLKDSHLGPTKWRPRPKVSNVFAFASKLKAKKPDIKHARKTMPPLLKTYLAMGGWVSDHAVIDNAMNTLHVFTGLEVNAIPKNRKRLLLADAQGLG